MTTSPHETEPVDSPVMERVKSVGITVLFALVMFGVIVGGVFAAAHFANKDHVETIDFLEEQYDVTITEHHTPHDEFGSWTIDGHIQLCSVDGDGKDRRLLCAADLTEVGAVNEWGP